MRDAYNAALVDGRAAGPQWSGDPDRCAAGSEAEASRGATVEAINFIRAMNHLAPVGLDAAAGDRARAAALIMRANNGLSHTPPRTWRCWSDAGASAAANGNLSLGPRNGVDHILAYLRDPGPGNGAVGHRRWLLYPPLAGVGTATTDTTNVLVVVGPALQARPAVPVVSWPPAGQVPWPLVFERFSISSPEHPQADFSRAELSVSANGVALPVTPEPVVDGYGDNTLVARVAIPDDLRAAGADTAFEVTARNVVARVDGVGGGNGATSLTFTVRFTAFTDTSTWDPASAADAGSAEGTVEPAAPLAGGGGPGRIAGSAAPSGTRSPA
ncbi:MAG TPA: CAP domain-containing protein, partial [Miltoncostaeaceae bacterium]|nr:CAP domain-containing protein [Miltoncostaeaceae bacterium]